MADKMRKLGLKVALAGLSSYRSGIQSVNQGNRAVQESMVQTAEQSKKLDLGMAALSGAMMGLASEGIQLLIGGFKKLGQEIYQMASEAGVVAGLKGAFEGLSASVGMTGAEMLNKFRVATGGMVTMQDAMMSFNKAAQLISTDFAVMIPDAMQYLGKVSRATGANLDYLLDSLVVGIGRLSPMILDNLSIQVSLAEASERASQMFGIGTKELSKQQKQLGMANVVMEKLAQNTAHMPGVTGTATAQMASFQTVLKDTRVEIGLKFLPLLSESMGVMNTLANAVLPKLIPIAENVANSLIGMVEWVKRMVPAQEIFAILTDTFGAFRDVLSEALSGPMAVFGNWFGIIKAQVEGITKLLFGDFVGSLESVSEAAKKFFYDTIGPAIMEISQYLTYFLRVASNVFTGIEAFLRGDTERATKFFTQAFNTAIATVIALLQRAAGEVIAWGRELMASYSKGIIEGIKAYLTAALQSVATFLRSFMAPGSPPKFLPDIGNWGAGAMNEYIKGMEHADFGMLSGFTSQFRSELADLVQVGDLGAGAFADTFFELRGTVMQVMDTFKETGKVAAGALDILPEKLGKAGEAMAELIEKQLAFGAIEEQLAEVAKQFSEIDKAEEALSSQVSAAMAEIEAGLADVTMQETALDLALQPFINDLERLQAQEAIVTDDLREQFESGKIGLEEYEDRVKAAKDQTKAAKKALDLEKAGQIEARQALDTQKTIFELQEDAIRAEEEAQRAILEEQRTAIQEEAAAIEAKRQALAEEIQTVQDRLAFHRETLAIMKQQDQILKQMAEKMPALGGMGAAGEGAMALPSPEDLVPEIGGPVIESLDAFRQRMENLGDMSIEPFDLGELLPDVEAAKTEVATWFGNVMVGIETAVQQSPVAQWILNGIMVKLPEVITGIQTWMESNFPMAFYMVPKILEAIFSGDFQTALQLAVGWFEWFKSYIIIWWMTQIEPALRPFKEWWEQTWPILQAIAVTAWTVISSVVSAAVGVIVEDVWPKLQQAWDNLSESLHLGEITWSDVWNAIKTSIMVVGAVIGAVILAAISIVVGFANAIASVAQTVTSAMKNLSQGWTKIWAAMTATLELAKQFVLAIIHGDFAAAWEAIKGGLEATKVFWSGVWQVIKGTFEATIGAILSIVLGFVEGVIDFFTNLYNDLVGQSIIPDMLTAMFDFFKTAFENILTKVGEFVQGVIDFFVDLWNGLLGPEGTVTTIAKDVFDTITGIIDSIITTIGLKVTEFTSLGANLMQGFIGGIKDAIINIKNAIGEVIGAAIDAGKQALGIESPSKVFGEMAAYSSQGWTDQWDKEIPRIERNMAMNVAPALMMGGAPAPMGTTNTTNNVDRSVRYGDRNVNMPVTVIDSKVSLAEFKEMQRQVFTERG